MMLFVPFFPSIPVALPGLDLYYLVPWPWVNRIVTALSLLFPVLATIAYRRLPEDRFYARAVFPLCALPLASAGFWIPGLIPQVFASNFLFFLPLVLLALTLHRAWPGITVRLEAQSPRRLFVMLIGSLTLFYTLTGWVVNARLGEHAVDEGHYLIQARSLYEDGDLNIRNNMRYDVDGALKKAMARHHNGSPEVMAELRAHELRRIRAYLHVSSKSPENRWYSWHPFGISLFIAPTMGAGLLPRQAVLGLISAMGIGLAFLLCLQTGRSKAWSFMMGIYLAASTFWWVYSIRALPEVLGGTLLAAAMYAGFLARTRPLAALFLVAGSCAYIPVAQPRFLPGAAIAALFFLVRVFHVEPISTRMRRVYLVVMTLALLGAATWGWIYQQMLNSITAYPLKGVLWAYPEGAWLSLFSERGLFFALPMGVLLVFGTLGAMRGDRTGSLYMRFAMAALLVMLLIVCTTDSWDGGPTMPGRYLVVVIPLLLPGAVWLVERAPAPGFVWTHFLALYSCAPTFIGIGALGRMQEAILRVPFQAMREWFPLFRDLFAPYRIAPIKVGHPYHGWETITANPFPVLLTISSLLLLWPARNHKTMLLRTYAGLALLIVGSALLHHQHGASTKFMSPARLEATLSTAPLQGARLYGPTEEAAQVWSYPNRFDAFRPRALTTLRDASAGASAVVQSSIEPNDWDGRGYRWFTLVEPFSPGWPGPRRFHVQGTLEGDLQLQMVLRQNQHIIVDEIWTLEPNQPFDYDKLIHTPAWRGHVYMLFRVVNGEGTIRFDQVEWSALINVADETAK